MPTDRPTPICLCEPFSSQGCPGTDGGTKPAVDPRFIGGSSAVHPQLINETRSALCSWLLTSGPTPICLCEPFSCKACPGKFRHPLASSLQSLFARNRTYLQAKGGQRPRYFSNETACAQVRWFRITSECGWCASTSHEITITQR